jgi:hypothetical protein
MADRGSTALPALEPLREVCRRLEANGVGFALGASGLLHALGLVDHVRDWDLTTDAELESIHRMFDGVAYERCGPSGVHADNKLRLAGGTVELIVRMAFHSPAGICRIPTLRIGTWRGVPLGSPEAWAVAYSLLGRWEKAELLFSHLRERGANAGALDRMLREPLPPALAGRLVALRQPRPA